MTAASDITAADAVAAARRLSPWIAAARDEIERLRQVPPALADALAEAGLYRLYVPRSAGGAELPPPAAFEVIKELSRVDGSVGWCVMNANVASLGLGWLAPDAARFIAGGPPLGLRAAGSLRPQGQARPAEGGGWQVTGRWNFASGVRNADWLHCPCVVTDEGGAPRRTEAGAPVTRTAWVPAVAVPH